MIFKKYLPSGLYWRTFLIVVIPVLLLQIAVSAVFFDRHWSKMTERLASAVTGEIRAISEQIDVNKDNPEKQTIILDIASRYLSLVSTYHADVSEFPVRGGAKSEGIARDLAKVMERKVSYPFQISVYPDDKLVIVDLLLDDGLLSVNVPSGRIFSSSSYIFILWMMGLSVLFFTVSLVFMRNQIRPIYRLGLIAERLGRGIPVGRFKPTGAREVRQAGEAFIRMQDRINQFIDQRTAMLAGVSHDLKTPLTRMKLQLEMLGDTPDTDALRGDIADMERMIGGYLSFAKGDGGEETKRIELDSFLDKLADNARRLSLDVVDRREKTAGKIIWAKPQALERALTNFIGNAARYADKMKITSHVIDDMLYMEIEDNGPGIPKDQYEAVLRPFFRGETSRNQKTGGVGLGLTIANDIISSHAGTLSLARSESLGGLKVVVTLPL